MDERKEQDVKMCEMFFVTFDFKKSSQIYQSLNSTSKFHSKGKEMKNALTSYPNKTAAT